MSIECLGLRHNIREKIRRHRHRHRQINEKRGCMLLGYPEPRTEPKLGLVKQILCLNDFDFEHRSEPQLGLVIKAKSNLIIEFRTRAQGKGNFFVLFLVGLIIESKGIFFVSKWLGTQIK